MALAIIMNFDDDTKDLCAQLEDLLGDDDLPPPPVLIRQNALDISEIEPHWSHYQDSDYSKFFKIPPGNWTITFK